MRSVSTHEPATSRSASSGSWRRRRCRSAPCRRPSPRRAPVVRRRDVAHLAVAVDQPERLDVVAERALRRGGSCRGCPRRSPRRRSPPGAGGDGHEPARAARATASGRRGWSRRAPATPVACEVDVEHARPRRPSTTVPARVLGAVAVAAAEATGDAPRSPAGARASTAVLGRVRVTTSARRRCGPAPARRAAAVRRPGASPSGPPSASAAASATLTRRSRSSARPPTSTPMICI